MTASGAAAGQAACQLADRYESNAWSGGMQFDGQVSEITQHLWLPRKSLKTATDPLRFYLPLNGALHRGYLLR